MKIIVSFYNNFYINEHLFFCFFFPFFSTYNFINCTLYRGPAIIIRIGPHVRKYRSWNKYSYYLQLDQFDTRMKACQYFSEYIIYEPWYINIPVSLHLSLQSCMWRQTLLLSLFFRVSLEKGIRVKFLKLFYLKKEIDIYL